MLKRVPASRPVPSRPTASGSYLGVWCAVLLQSLLAASCFAAVTVNATLEPQQIAVGESAQLTITSSEMNAEPISVPTVPGLEFRIVGQSRRLEMINGATLATTSLILRVTADAAGTYAIPGLTPKSQPLVLRVTSEPGGAQNGPRFNGRPLLAGGGGLAGVRLSPDGSAFVRLSLPKHQVYVGESVPVDIELGMRAGFVTSLNGLPTLTGSEFTLNNLSHQPERSERVIDGEPFTLLTWHSVLAPVKPGAFSFSVETPLTVRIRTRSARDSRMDDLLGDPFMQNFFGATVPKDITVSSPATDLTVLELPKEGRPADFTGAVGSFKIASELSSNTAAVGDPVTLRMKVSGSGNFDRVDSPLLTHLEQWKTYPPKSSFAAADATGFKGEKTFEQPLIASQPGRQKLPPLAFSYFDPNTKRYETARSAPLEVSVSPSVAERAPSAAAPAGNELTANRNAAAGPGLRADHPPEPRILIVASLVPLYLRPGFLAIPSTIGLSLIGGWLFLRRRTSVSGPPWAALRRGHRTRDSQRLERMSAAAAAGDAIAFLSEARGALQDRFATLWRLQPDQVTTGEVETRLGKSDPKVRALFALADEANYSHGLPQAPDYPAWIEFVRSRLTEGTAA